MTRKPQWMGIPQLMDREWLIAQKIARKSAATIGRELGVSERTIRTAMTYHKITSPYARIGNGNPELQDRIKNIR